MGEEDFYKQQNDKLWMDVRRLENERNQLYASLHSLVLAVNKLPEDIGLPLGVAVRLCDETRRAKALLANGFGVKNVQ